MENKYKYNPENYRELPLLTGDMIDFYSKYENHKLTPNKENYFSFKRSWDTLYFSIKHRAVEESITDEIRDEMWSYFGGLIHD